MIVDREKIDYIRACYPKEHNLMVHELADYVERLEESDMECHSGWTADIEHFGKIGLENQTLRELLRQGHGPLCGNLINLETGKCAICEALK